jgi:uncharacterized protein (TIGR02246 family)
MRLIRFATILIIFVFVFAPGVTQAASSDMTPDEKAVRAAVDQWFVVLNAMFAGDPEPFAELYSHADDATYMGAEGTYRIGWKAIYDDWKKQAAKSLGGKVHGEEIHVVVDGNMATATHYTKGTVKTDEDKVVDQRVRETSVFRKEDGAWKMIGHQADNYPVWVDVVNQ